MVALITPEFGADDSPVFSEDRIERDFLAMMSQLTARHIVDSSIANACPVGVVGKKNKLRGRVYKLLDKPRTRNPVNFYFLTSNPLHTAPPLPSRGYHLA